MARNSREGNRTRAARRREALADRGIKQVLLLAPEQAHPLLKQAVGLMIREDDPMEPRAALRRAGGANEPDDVDASPELHAELEAAKARIAQIEVDAERQRQALEAERDTAKAAEAVEREKAETAMAEARTASERAVDAEGRASGTLRRAKATEKIVQKVQDMPGVRGWLVRWLVGDALE